MKTSEVCEGCDLWKLCGSIDGLCFIIRHNGCPHVIAGRVILFVGRERI